MSLMPSDYGIRRSVYLEQTNDNYNEPKELVEWNIDTETGEFIVNDDGTIDMVYGLDALKVRVWLKLNTYRGRYVIFSNEYGNRLKDCIGRDKKELMRVVEDELNRCLVDNVYITNIRDIEIDDSSSTFNISFTVVNIYGNYEEKYSI